MATRKLVSENDVNLIQQLKAHPKLHKRVKSLLSLVENDEIRLADEAEENVTKELHKAGKELLEEWGQDQAKKRADEMLKTRGDLKKACKKNSTGTRHTEKS